MKKLAKILSVVLALSMVLAICIMPASAVDNTHNEYLTIDVQATFDSTDDSDLKIYKIDVYADSTNSLAALQLFLSWDDSALELIRNNKARAVVINANNIIIQDSDNPFYDGDAYNEWEGAFTGEGAYDNDLGEFGYAQFPFDQGTKAAISKLSDGALGTTLKERGYTGVYWNWMTEFTDNFLLVSGGKHRSEESPIGGRQKVLSFYVKEKADATPGTYTLGANEEQHSRVSGTFTDGDNMDSKSIPLGTGMTSLDPEWITINNAQITIGDVEAEGPVVDKAENHGAQVKFTKNEPLNEKGVNDEYLFRIKSEIKQEDWDKYFANTADGGNNAITEVGVVAYQGTDGFDAETAKKVVNGEGTEKYSTASTNYIQKTETSAYFGAIIKLDHKTCNYDTTYMGYVKYNDAEGSPQIVFYKTAYEAGTYSGYDNAVSSFLGS